MQIVPKIIIIKILFQTFLFLQNAEMGRQFEKQYFTQCFYDSAWAQSCDNAGLTDSDIKMSHSIHYLHPFWPSY